MAPSWSERSRPAPIVATTWALDAAALTVEVPTREPTLVGAAFTYRAVVADATGAVEYRWNFGDGTRTEFEAGRTEIAHTMSSRWYRPH
jgi:hypothetical protein